MSVTAAAFDLYLPDAELIQSVQPAIDNFEQSTAPSAWVSLNKTTLIAELRARVSNPFQINQGGQPFCGPASVLFELIRKQPERYIQLCQSLFERGGFQCKTRWIQASEKLQQNPDQNFRMEQIDWMVLSTMRESENLLFSVEPNAPELIRNLAGMTKSWELKGWVEEILGYSQTDYHHAYLLSDFNAFNASIATLQNGGIACLLITAEGMLSDNPPPIPFPSHWVTLLGNAEVTRDRVMFDVYTWSKIIRVDLNVADFKKYFWASVTGSPA
jgi:hypothetical protein